MGWLKKMTGGKISTPKNANDLVKGYTNVMFAGGSEVLDAFGLGGGGKSVNVSGQEAAQAQAIQEYLAALAEYKKTGVVPYEYQGDLTADFLEDAKDLDDTTLKDIETNPAYDQYTMDALRQLEGIATSGMTDADRADMARLEQDVNRQNAGRVGAIRQNMAARGLDGSGSEIVMQMQAAQDAADRQALAALEKSGQMQTNRQNATMNLGNMAQGLQAQQWNQKAQVANAQDAINQFNTNNKNQVAQYNNQLANQTNQYNAGNRQANANLNTEAQNQFNQNVVQNAGQGAQIQYNQAADSANRAIQQQTNKQQAKNQGIGNLIGAAGAIGAFMSDEEVKDNVQDESPEAIEDFLNKLSGKSYNYKGEDKPRHGILAQDLEQSKIGSDMIRDVDGLKGVDVNDAIGALFQAVAHLNRKVK